MKEINDTCNTSERKVEIIQIVIGRVSEINSETVSFPWSCSAV